MKICILFGNFVIKQPFTQLWPLLYSHTVNPFLTRYLVWGTYAISTDPVQMPQNVASDQGSTLFAQRNLHAKYSKSENIHQKPLNLEMGSSK